MSAAEERSAAVRAWEHLLDRLEEDATDLRCALAAGTAVPVQTWSPPSDLGPLPSELQDRAELVISALADAQRRTRLRLTELSDELAGIDQRRKAGAAYASG
jgi:hypothetical protein